MRKVLFVAGLILLTSGIAGATCNKFEVGGGYRYVRVSSQISAALFSSNNSINANGWDAEAAFDPNCWLGIVADFGGVYASPFGVSTHVYTETFGPRVSLFKSGPINPFVEGLFGAAQLGAHTGGCVSCGIDFSDNAFAGQFGGGVDINFGGPFALRTRLDDIYTRFGSQNQNSLGVTAEVVFKFGGH